MNDARDVSSAAFRINRIQYHNHTFMKKGRFAYLLGDDEAIPVNIYLGVDVAATATKTSDYQVILVLGVDSNGKRYVIDYFRERIPTFDVPEKIIEYAKKYSPVRRVTIETVAAQEMVRDMVTRMAVQDRRLVPGIFKGVRPPAGIKKADRLETSLGPIVNSKKLYVRKEMTEIMDEFFEHPLPRHDDILDALYYADYFARMPRSASLSIESYDKAETKVKIVKKAYNWMTGAKI